MIQFKDVFHDFNLFLRIFKEVKILGYKRSMRNQKMHYIRIKIPFVNDEKKAKLYLGKKVIYTKKLGGSNSIKWGKITSLHGRSGGFLVKFKKNINPDPFDHRLLVVPFPS